MADPKWLPQFNEDRDAAEMRRTPVVAPVIMPEDPRWKRVIVHRVITPQEGTRVAKTDVRESGSSVNGQVLAQRQNFGSIPERVLTPQEIEAAVVRYRETGSVSAASKAIGCGWGRAKGLLADAGVLGMVPPARNSPKRKPGPKPRAAAEIPAAEIEERILRARDESAKALSAIQALSAAYGDEVPASLAAAIYAEWQRRAGVRPEAGA